MSSGLFVAGTDESALQSRDKVLGLVELLGEAGRTWRRTEEVFHITEDHRQRSLQNNWCTYP